MMKYFSGEGDQGETRLFGNQRLSKANIFFELVGSLDEVTAYLGMARSLCKEKKLASIILNIQAQISMLMGELTMTANTESNKFEIINEYTGWLESQINTFDPLIQKPHSFIYAGESTLGAVIDIARTAIRKAERISVKYFSENHTGEKEILMYLNRLSSFVFVLRLYIDSLKG